MIVRAVRIRTSPKGPNLAEHPALRIGGEYLVLEIECNRTGVAFRVLDEQGDPSMWSADCFELVNGSIPSSWKAATWSNGTLYLAPRSWHQSGFWDHFFSNSPTEHASETFRDEVEAMRREGEAS